LITAVLVLLIFRFGYTSRDGSDTTNPDLRGNAAVENGTQRSEPDTLVIKGRLTEILGKFVDNDAYNYVYIMKYRVINVEKGRYKPREILVGHYNPLIARKLVKDRMDPFVDGTVERFSVGAKHRLRLVYPIESVWDGAIEDEYYDTDLKKYYALSADVLEFE
jgi:hypothetical protein